MIIKNISVCDFGIYRGYQSMDLTPRSGKPIVLFGGLNGGGKTTLLDALQLALYGKLARCSNRGGLSYQDYLRRCIHKQDNPISKTALMLEFEHTAEGKTSQYRIQREWYDTGRSISETFYASRDGVLDSVLTEQWLEFMDELLPVTIAHLFFFDGEKIESFADPESSAELLAKAMQSVLGLDLVDQLVLDLEVLERRKKTRLLDDQQKMLADELTDEEKSLEKANDTTTAHIGTLTQEIDDLEKAIASAEIKFKNEGGDLFEQRTALEQDHKRFKEQLKSARDDLRQMTHGPAPLLLVEALLGQLDAQYRKEEQHDQNGLLVQLLEERDRTLLSKINDMGIGKFTKEALSDYLAQDRGARQPDPDFEAFLSLPEDGHRLLQDVLPPRRSALEQALEEKLELSAQTEELCITQERRLQSVPAVENVQELIERLQDLKVKRELKRKEVEGLQVEREARQAELERVRSKRHNMLENIARQEFDRWDARRLVTHSKMARTTLGSFREKVLNHHIRRIEGLILESFQSLLRKDNFIKGFKIDPGTFRPTLIDTNDIAVAPDRLSAGERQLLAVSMLWGLARASGRSLPVVIDTPLGRLDSNHRANLVERYFPHASKQVVLLSTDEEIDKDFFTQLSPSISRTFELKYHEEGYTSVNEGYFWPSRNK